MYSVVHKFGFEVNTHVTSDQLESVVCGVSLAQAKQQALEGLNWCDRTSAGTTIHLQEVECD